MFLLAVILGFVLLIIGVPIFMVFAISGGLVTGIDLGIPWSNVAQHILEAVTKYTLIAIPLFVLAANIMVKGGLSQRLVDMFASYVQHVRGGIAITLILSIAFFGSICGSILAAIVAIGGIMIPQMVKHGYSRAFSAALCAAVAGVDSLIPPSNIAIIYSSITGIPVGKTFMAGLIPGIFQACVLSLYCIIISGKIKHVAPASWKQRLNATYRALPICLMPILILGGIYTGVFSAVEAAGLASVYALIVSGFIYRELSLSGLWEALVETVITTAIMASSRMK